MVKIIQVDSSYAQILSDLGRGLFYQTYVSYNSPSDMKEYLDSTYTLEIQTKELQDPTMVAFIAFNNDNEPIGYCQLKQNKHVEDCVGDPEAIELKRIYIDKASAGKGVGRLLINTCIEKSKSLEKKRIWLSVWDNNPEAIKFYEHLGFKKVGMHIFELGKRRDIDYIYVKDI